jgi:hypothetical protein
MNIQCCDILHAMAGPGEPMALSVEVEACWVTQPDIVVKLMPSKRFKLSHVDIRPSMYVKVDHLEVEGHLRLVFPLQLTLPIFSGLSFSFLTAPKVLHCLRLLPDAYISAKRPHFCKNRTGIIT